MSTVSLYAASETLLSDMAEVLRLYMGGVTVLPNAPGGDMTIRHTEEIADGVRVVRVTDGERCEESRERITGDAVVDKRLRRRQAKLGVYGLMKRRFGFAPPWGSLTGIRPTRLLYANLNKGMTMDEAVHELQRVFDVNDEKAAVLRTAGVNRLSVGAQSFADATLRGLGRIHTANETRECVELARAAGFDNIGLDVIYGVPGVARELFCTDIEAALALAPDHLSCYCLEIEPGTPFASEVAAGRMAVDEDEQREQFDWARQRLTAAGFNHYEISNFARPGHECRHNELYWTGGDYSGVGPGAHSHWQGRRWGNTTELPMWKRDFEEQLDPRKKACETLVMGLRRLAGWRREEFRAVTGFDYDEVRGPEIARLVADGLLVAESDGVRLAEDALFVSDSVFADLV